MRLFWLGFALLCGNGLVTFAAKDLATTYIGKGTEAVPHSAPYVVTVSYTSSKYQHGCSGTIISPSWVITVASCFIYERGMIVIAGAHDRTKLDVHAQQRVTDFVRRHPLYYATFAEHTYNIVCMHMSEPFEFNAFVQPVTLPLAGKTPAPGNAHLYGWGQRSSIGSLSSTLQTSEMTIVDNKTCEKQLPADEKLDEYEFCTISNTSGVSACYGDMGSPLVIERPGMSAELVGITKRYFLSCGLNNKPTIYLNIADFVNWIREVETAYAILY